jgi:hypothetical protein
MTYNETPDKDTLRENRMNMADLAINVFVVGMQQNGKLEGYTPNIRMVDEAGLKKERTDDDAVISFKGPGGKKYVLVNVNY